MMEFSLQWLVVAVDVSVKAILLAGVAALVLRISQFHNSNLRHRVWTGMLIGMLFLPVLSPLVLTLPLPLPFAVPSGWSIMPSPDGQPAIVRMSQPDGDDEMLAGRVGQPPSLISFNPHPFDDRSFGQDGWSDAAPFHSPANALEAGGALADSTSQTADTIWPYADEPENQTVEGAVILTRPLDMPRPARWPVVLFGLWLGGIGIMALRLIIGLGYSLRLANASTAITAEDLIELDVDPRLLTDGRRAVSVGECPLIHVPLALGIIHPRILLPSDWPAWPADKLHAVIAHERAHIQRADCTVNFLAEVNRCLYWYHPLAWWIRTHLGRLAETACDDAAINCTGNRTTYARHLLEFASAVSSRRRLITAGISMARPSNVETRITDILDDTRPLSHRLTWTTTILLLGTLIPIITVTAAVKPTPNLTHEESARQVARGEAEVTATLAQEEDRGVNSNLLVAGPIVDFAADAAETDAPSKNAQVTGSVVGADGTPLAGVNLAVIAQRIQTKQGGDLSNVGEVLAEATSDVHGQYQFTLPDGSGKSHRNAYIIARADGLAVAWKKLNLDTSRTEATLRLEADQPIKGRLIDIDGQPADGVRLSVLGLLKTTDGNLPTEWVSYRGGPDVPAAWAPTIVSDDQGRFTIRGIPVGYGTFLNSEGSDRFAPQSIALNTGMPEQRGERDGTYRSLTRNLEPGEEVVLPLAPAQVFEGVVRYEDTGEPAPHARLTIWASQQEYGSMISVGGEADANGHYRIIPNPGIRFGVNAYPPHGLPYLARKTPIGKALRWEATDRVKTVDVTLPRGILVKGQVLEAGSGEPVVGASIQYIPEGANNDFVSDDILTGWQGIQVSDEGGRFEIAVLPGPGRLLVHGPNWKFVLQEIGGQELSRNRPGGRRNYAHAIERLEPQTDDEVIEVSLELQRGETATGRLVDERGETIEEAVLITRLAISPHTPYWRGSSLFKALDGRFELNGLAKDQQHTVHFLDAEHRLGATATLTAANEESTIVLRPCGRAKMRFVDEDGQPVADQDCMVEIVVTPGEHQYDSASMNLGKFASDSDFIANIDRVNYATMPLSDENGALELSALIPGATYQIVLSRGQRFEFAKTFQVEADEILDLGEIVVEKPE